MLLIKLFSLYCQIRINKYIFRITIKSWFFDWMLSLVRLLHFRYWQGSLFTYHSLLWRIWIFFIAPTKSYRKIFMENSEGLPQSQIRTFIFLINGQNYWQAANNGATHFFPWFFPILLSFLWFPYNYFIVQIYRGGAWSLCLPGWHPWH